jgi:predicted GNAT superfamily acetyltransferase
VTDPWDFAAAAADRAGVRVVELSGSAFEDASALLQKVWRADHPAEVASPSLLRTYAHSGSYVAGAFRGDELVGVTTGFFGRGHLHSFVAGTLANGRGVGFAMKQHQRAWTLERGVGEVHWTYDPLILRNAYFNLQKLGVTVTAYLPEFYGPMTDGINAGDLTDRLYVVWHLASPAVHDVELGDAVALVDRAGDEPLLSTVDAQRHAVSVAVPPDAESLRAQHPAAALRWRLAVREALAGRLAAGWRVDGITRDGRYLLRSLEGN